MCEVGPPVPVTIASTRSVSSVATMAGARSAATSTNGASCAGTPGRGPAGELRDEPVADVGDVARALREVAAERLELLGDRLGGLPDGALGHQPVVDHALLGVGDERRVGGDRGRGVQEVGAVALGAVGGGVERGADHLGRRADPLGLGGVVGAGREPTAGGRLRDRVGHEHGGRDDASRAHPDAGDDRGGWLHGLTGRTSSST